MASFNKIVQDIKSLKIQGATNVAIAGLKAISKKSRSISEFEKGIQALKNSRPTEPMLQNVLDKLSGKILKSKNLDKTLKKETQKKISELKRSHELIAKKAQKKIKQDATLFTHCHSSTVTKAIICAKSKNVSVINTETRPRYQGRLTAKELVGAGIKTKMIVDSAMANFIPEADCVFVGADAMTTQFFVNKVGTFNLAILAKLAKVPVYVLADKLKFTEDVEIEYRNPKEIWSNPPKKLEIVNPAFDMIPWCLVKGVITQDGVKKPENFVKSMNDG